MLSATAVPGFSFQPTASFSGQRTTAAPSFPHNRWKSLQNPLLPRQKESPRPIGVGGERGEIPASGWLLDRPLQRGMQEGLFRDEISCDLLKRKDMVGWLESPHVFRLTKLSYSVCNSHARSGPMREEAAGMGVFRFLASCSGGSRHVLKGGEGFLSYNGSPGTLPFLHSASL